MEATHNYNPGNYIIDRVLFGAFTGQRPQATLARLTLGQFTEAIQRKKPVIDVQPEQDKIRMQHYCPLHPQVVESVLQALHSQADGCADV